MHCSHSHFCCICPSHPRCNIPVVVRGETGCGKTRLIRFMCDMMALGAGGGIDYVRNMVTMKVHEY